MTNLFQSALVSQGKILTELLNALPFNGEKMKLALWVGLLSALQVLTGIDMGIALDPSITLPVSLIAAGTFLIHKILKRKLGYDAWGESIK